MSGFGDLFLKKAFDLSKKAYNVVSEAVGSSKSPFEVVEVPLNQLNSQNAFCSDASNVPGRLFKVLFQCSRQQLYHVICIHPSSSAVGFSVYRSTEKSEALAVRDRFEAQSFLVNILGSNKEAFGKLIEAMHEHPYWHTIHYVVYLDCYLYFDYISGDPNISQLLNVGSNPEGMFPLHLACDCGHVDTVKRLLSLGADVTKQDPNSQNAVHYAAMSSNSKVITELSKSPGYSFCLNAKNGSGFSPLFLAIRNKKCDCVGSLLATGAAADEPCIGRLPLQEAVACGDDHEALQCTSALVRHCPWLVLQKDPSTGNTPMHTISNGQILDAMLACTESLNVNEKNAQGQTALHIFVVKGLTHCVMKFLAHGGDPNIADKDGNTALHLAAKVSHLDIVKAVLLFGANGTLKNSAGKTAAQVAGMCANKTLGSEIQFCIQKKSGEQVLPESFEPEDNALEDFAQAMALSSAVKKRDASVGHKINLLSLDGGGIRGLVLIQILLHLESHLGSSIVDKFNWIGGTSTGGILGIALSLGKSLHDCQRLYFRFKDAVFKGMRPYDTSILENFLKNEIGVDKTMADIQSRRLTVTTVLADKQPVKLVLFRNYQLPVSHDENITLGYISPAEQILWKAARCSSAAPTYFSKVDGKYVDGGLIANNPTLDLLTELNNHNLAAKYVDKPKETIELGCVLSVGTGHTPNKPINTDSLDLGLPSGPLDAFSKAFAVKDLGNLLIDQVTATEGRPVDRSRAWCNSMAIPYFRFSTPFSLDVPLDETDDSVLIKVLWETELYMQRCKKHVKTLVDFLKYDVSSSKE